MYNNEESQKQGQKQGQPENETPRYISHGPSTNPTTLQEGQQAKAAKKDKSPKKKRDKSLNNINTVDVNDRDDIKPVVRRTDATLATKFSFAVLAQFCPCAFRATDRQGKRRGLAFGFPGLQCRHCFGADRKGGRFFPSTIKTMADTKKTLVSIKNHLMKCSKCPDPIKEKINELEVTHEEERRAQKYGSQKAFFSNIWGRLHDGMDREDVQQHISVETGGDVAA